MAKAIIIAVFAETKEPKHIGPFESYAVASGFIQSGLVDRHSPGKLLLDWSIVSLEEPDYTLKT